jgi:GNAT superfamily N-acetyltransferase
MPRKPASPARRAPSRTSVETHPVTPDRWDDLIHLFGERGAVSGCWCMWWRLSSKEFDATGARGRRSALEALVAEGREPGLLAYRDGEPVGWAAVAPRDEFPRIERSPKLKPVDDQPAWCVNCFYIDRRHRNTGVSRALLAGAVAFARERGARLVEGYPIDTRGEHSSAEGLWTGTLDMFERASFVEVARRGGRPLVRRRVRPPRSAAIRTSQGR